MRYFYTVMLLCVFVYKADAAEPLEVFVSILPQKFLVEKIGGDRVSVSVMVRPGLSPETYEPTPKQMAALEKTRLYFRIAVPFESVWIDRLQSINKTMRVIECCGPLSLDWDSSAYKGHTDEKNEHVNDFHVWTSPGNAIVLAGIIRQALIDIDPGNRSIYETNYQSLVNKLETLDEEIRQVLGNLTHRYMIVSHPSWEHFARAYNLKQVSIEQHGSEVRSRELARLIQLCRRENIRTVFVQKQFNPASAEVLAREINGQVIEIDPLAGNYIDNLRHVARLIRESATP